MLYNLFMNAKGREKPQREGSVLMKEFYPSFPVLWPYQNINAQ